MSYDMCVTNWLKVRRKKVASTYHRQIYRSYAVKYHLLFNANNLPTYVVSAVFKTKLRPRFIGMFTAVAKKGIAHAPNVPRKLRTHPVFFVGLL